MVFTLFMKDGWDSYLGSTDTDNFRSVGCLLHIAGADQSAVCNVRKGDATS
jgi:hypothetical protein